MFFANSRVDPSCDYTYDAIYRLIEATGRENAAAAAPPPNREGPWPTGGFPSADALRTYTQRYRYDAVGNFVEMVHAPGTGSGWTRHYKPGTDSNRLDQTWYGSHTGGAVTYHHDAHGNMLNLNRVETPPPLDPEEKWGLHIRWDWRDMILGIDLGGGGLARYHYGIDKQRTRKRITRQGNGVEDRIYLGGYELYRRFKSDRTTLVEEIEMQHLFEGEQRVLLVDDVIRSGGATDPRPDGLPVKEQTLFRYQYGNHLGSACLELDHRAEIVSYEEYHPYGTSAYRLMESRMEAPPKRYRYTGMERDDESGMHYHLARYYANCLARWSSYDQKYLEDGPNIYQYTLSNPIRYTDPSGSQHVEQVAAEDPLVAGCVGGECYFGIRQSKFQELQNKEAERQWFGTLSAVASNPFSAIFWNLSNIITDDPSKQAAAAQLGVDVFGVASASAGVADRLQQMKSVASAQPQRPVAAFVRPATNSAVPPPSSEPPKVQTKPFVNSGGTVIVTDPLMAAGTVEETATTPNKPFINSRGTVIVTDPLMAAGTVEEAVTTDAQKINWGQQNKHVLFANERDTATRPEKPGQPPRSKSLLVGEPETLAQGGSAEQRGPIAPPAVGSKELVDFGQVIGWVMFPGNLRYAEPTFFGMRHYATKGVHIVPHLPK
ncbi:RHS repeat-associated core domain-containing protein [Amaricoccus sp. W119]|uniref:RHS repeat-associated core domain-containing protein n=1 Tax=Amaricoccus sp. W119 TaxID=3391833 RepID=UPI0039A761A0